MRKLIDEYEYFKENDIVGAYETRDVTETTNHHYKFEDTKLEKIEDNLVAKRRMSVGGKNFIVSSIFGANHNQTPTKKLLDIMK